jgi:hypothetical protein
MTNDEKLLVEIKNALTQTEVQVENETEEKPWEDVANLLRKLIEALGYKYADKHMLDDTPTNFMMAKKAQDIGYFKSAATSYFYVLRTRYRCLQTKFQGLKLGFELQKNLEKIKTVLENNEFSEASESLKQCQEVFTSGLKAIKRSYWHGHRADDNTKEQLREADEAEKNGQIEKSAKLRFDALKYRQEKLLQMYKDVEITK